MYKSLVSALAFLLLPISLANAEERTISPLQVSYQSIKLDKKKALTLAKFDAIVIDRFAFEKVTSNTWSFLKSNNPTDKTKPLVFVYQLGPLIRDDQDKMTQYYLNNVGRYNNDRGVSGDALYTSHKDWFQKGNLGGYLKISGNEYFLDFGNNDFRNYWNRITKTDIISQKWKGDGIFVDVSTPFPFTDSDKLTGGYPARYPDPASWDTAMNGFVSSAASFLRQNGQLSMFNRSNGQSQTGNTAWLKLDVAPAAPDYLMEEGAFVTSYLNSDAKVYTADDWERQVNLPTKLKGSTVVFLSHTNLDIDKSGISSAGTPTNFQQIFGFSLGSYLVSIPQSGKKPMFSFDYNRRGSPGYTNVVWLPVYDELKLGAPVSGLEKQQSGTATVYSRRFEHGTVYVNPTKNTSAKLQVTNAQAVTPDWSKGLVYGKVGEGATLPPYSAIIFIPLSVPSAPPQLKVEQ